MIMGWSIHKNILTAHLHKAGHGCVVVTHRQRSAKLLLWQQSCDNNDNRDDHQCQNNLFHADDTQGTVYLNPVQQLHEGKVSKGLIQLCSWGGVGKHTISVCNRCRWYAQPAGLCRDSKCTAECTLGNTPPLTELRAASIKIIVNITNIRDQSHFESMKILVTYQTIKAAMQNEGLSSEVTILESPTLHNKTGVIVTTTLTTVTTKGGADGLHTSVMLMVTIIVITVVTSTINWWRTLDFGVV